MPPQGSTSIHMRTHRALVEQVATQSARVEGCARLTAGDRRELLSSRERVSGAAPDERLRTSTEELAQARHAAHEAVLTERVQYVGDGAGRAPERGRLLSDRIAHKTRRQVY
jgi:hypothetical protein